MRILLFLLLLSPSLIYAGCGDCDEVHAEIEWETEMDSTYHDCRNCKDFKFDKDANCPKFGFVCEDKFYTNPLSATSNCECLKGRCAPNAKLWVTMEVDGVSTQVQKSKLNCNNSQWMVDGSVFESATCAKDCNLGTCKKTAPKFSSDFVPLEVTLATEGGADKCATAKCTNGFVTVKSNGIPEPLGPLSAFTVTCSGDGTWTWGMGESRKEEKNLMCIASKCGPLTCKPIVDGFREDAELVPLKVTGQGADCAKATCPGSVFVNVDASGNAGEEITGITDLTCDEGGFWKDGATAVRAMCKMPPCPGDCDPSTFIRLADGEEYRLDKPVRNGCEYSCPDSQGLFYYDTHLMAPVTMGHVAKLDHIGTTCVDNQYIVNSTLPVDRVGCNNCRFSDGQFLETTGQPPAVWDHCVLSCPDKYKLQYTIGDSSPYKVTSLYASLPDKVNIFSTWFYDAERGEAYRWDITPGSITEFRCVPL